MKTEEIDKISHQNLTINSNEFDNSKPTNLDSVTVNRDLSSDNEPSNKKHVDDSIGEGTIVRFNQTIENYLQVSVGNDTYIITK